MPFSVNTVLTQLYVRCQRQIRLPFQPCDPVSSPCCSQLTFRWQEEVVAFACKWVCRRYFFCYIIAVQPSHLIARPFYRFMILRLKFNSLQRVMWCQRWAKESFREMMLTCHFAPLNCTFHFLKGLIIFPCYHILNLRSPVLIKWPRDG